MERDGEGECFQKSKIERLSTYEKLVPWNINWSSIKAEFSGELIPSQELFRNILKAFWDHEPGKRKAVKRPKYEHRIAQLMQVFPDSQFIALIRDPRAVLASKKYYGGGIKDNWNIGNLFYIRLITSIIRWKLSVDTIRNAERAYGRDTVLVMKYEEIVRQPGVALKKIFSFVREDYSEEAIFLAIKKGFDSNSTFLSESATQEIFRKDAIDRWKNKLNPVELGLIEKTLGATMQAEGMGLVLPSLSLVQQCICSLNLLLFRAIFLVRRFQTRK
jgi:Sulfotransferase family